MSKYGSSLYGIDYYGAAQLVNFSVAPFLATPYDHQQIALSWANAGGAWTHIRLVRNSYGFPVNETDGVIVFDLNSGPSASGSIDGAITNYLDTGLAAGQFYYYSMFLYGLNAYNGRDDWRRAGDVQGLSVADYGYTQKLASQFPTVFGTDLGAIESATMDADTVLYRFLSLMGFELDRIRSEHDSLLNVNDPSAVSGGLLPLMANQYGLAYEPAVGMQQLRVLLRNIQHIYKVKGTVPGISALVEAFTNWGNIITDSPNLMLDYNDSSFEEGIGNWNSTSASPSVTLSQYISDGSVAAFSTGANKVNGLLKATMGSSGGLTMVVGNKGAGVINPGINSILYGIPVVPGQQYVASAYVRANTTVRAFTIGIAWYRIDGTYISGAAASSGGTNDATGSWTRISSPAVGGTAPSNAAYAAVNVASSAVALASGEIHYVDAVQFETGSTASAFQEARDQRITLLADRVNEVTNPNFETNTTGWTATGSTAISRVTTQQHEGAASMQIVNDSSASFVYTTTPLIPGVTQYTFSTWVYGPAGNYHLSHYQSTPSAGTQLIAGPTTAVPTNSWTRLSLTVTVPIGETAARWAIVGPASTTFFVDSVLVERGANLLPYFDAGISVTHPADYLWEGTTNASRSHYYINRQAKLYRIGLLLKDYVWNGSTFTLLSAQPGT